MRRVFIIRHSPVRGIRTVLLAFLAVGAVACAPVTRVDQGIAFVDVALIDVSGGSVHPGMTVVVSGERIVHVLPSRDIALGPDVEQVDGEGRFLIPGLWDMHVHFQGDADQVRTVEFPVFLAHGVTGIRVMSGCDSTYVSRQPGSQPCMTDETPGNPSPRTIAGWREEIVGGAIVGPRIVSSSMMFDGSTECYPSYTLESPEDAREKVRRVRNSGADFLKILNCSMSSDVYYAIVEEARALGIVVAGHVPRGVTLIEAANAGQKGIEHAAPSLLEACGSAKEVANARAAYEEGGFPAYLEGLIAAFDPAECGPLVAALLENGTFFSPTFVVNTNNVVNRDLRAALEDDDRRRYLVPRIRSLLETWIEEQTIDEATRTLYARYFDRLYEAVATLEQSGIPILAGSDTPNLLVYPGSGLHDELGILADAGLSPAAALAAATTAPARYLDLETDLGSVAPGMLADLVLLDANPLKDIGNTRTVRAVMANGRLFTADALDDLLEAAAVAAAK